MRPPFSTSLHPASPGAPRRTIRWARPRFGRIFNLLLIAGWLIIFAFLLWSWFRPLVIVILAILIYARRTLASHRRLLEEGAEATAYVRGVAYPLAYGLSSLPIVDYEFVVPTGQRVKKSATDWSGGLYEGSQARVFYDPGTPKDHVLECVTFYEVAEAI